MEKNVAPFLINGSYKDSNFRITFLLFDPTTILSGNRKSLIASPSRRNSGFETTSKNLFCFLFKIIFSILSPVDTGTVDLVTIILNLFMYLLISLATLKTYWRSADLFFLDVGVPTQINIISEDLTARDKFVVNFNPVSYTHLTLPTKA